MSVYRRRDARSLKNVFQSRRAFSSEVEDAAAVEDGAAVEACVEACVEAFLIEHAFWRGVERRV